MTKADLIEVVAKKTGLTKRGAAGALDACLGAVAKAIKKEKKLALSGFGTFTVRKRQPRLGRNPKTGEPIQIGASKTVGFKPAASLKHAL